MAPSCDTSIKTDGASSEIIPSPMEKFSHSVRVGICNHTHTARRIIRACAFSMREQSLVMSPGVSLHGSNPEPLISALGQKQTSWHLQPTSALPPKADIGTRSWNVRFVPKADIAPRSIPSKF
jgi:hypothetical protein